VAAQNRAPLDVQNVRNARDDECGPVSQPASLPLRSFPSGNWEGGSRGHLRHHAPSGSNSFDGARFARIKRNPFHMRDAPRTTLLFGDRRVCIDFLHVVEIFERIEQFLHF
jgi:hypothetical protein